MGLRAQTGNRQPLRPPGLVTRCDKPLAWLIHATRGAARSQLTTQAGLRIDVKRSEYVNFAVYNPKTAALPAEIPEHSFSHTSPGLNVPNPPSFGKLGMNASDYEQVFSPQMPVGEMVIEATLQNEGTTVVVDGVYVELLDATPPPTILAPNTFLPILDPMGSD